MTRILAAAALAVVIMAASASSADTFAVRLVSETSTTITLGWSPQPGYGYLFSADGNLVSRTNDPNRDTVRFSKQYSSFDVDVIVKGANGHYPIVEPPPPPKAQCEDGVDNDGDGKIDFPNDPGCTVGTDNDETDPIVPPPTGNLFVSTAGSDSNACTLAAPCRSLNRAYQVAQCGNVVSVAAGTYGDQQINEVAGLSNCSTDVTFRSAPGHASAISKIFLGTVCGCQGNPTTDGPDHITFDGFKLVGGFSTESDTTFVTFVNIDGGSFYIGAGNHITVRDSDWGPCYANTTSACQNGGGGGTYVQIVIADYIDGSTSDITLEGNTIHDFTYSDPAHFECIRTDGVHNLTLRGNFFHNCSLYGLTFRLDGATLIENNWFASTCFGGTNPQCGRGSSIVNLGDSTGTVIIRFNSFGPGEAIADEGSPTGNTQNRFVIGNIFGDTSCQTSRATYDYNAFYGTGGATCGAHAVYLGPNPPYVNGSGGATADYHLAGASAADNYVPASVPNSGVATDYDGQPRNNGARDAGADER